MKNKNGIVWIDLTDLSVWKGHLTGIQRLVYQITLGYAEKENVRYVTFDDSSNKFFETDFEPIRQQIEAASQVADHSGSGGTRSATLKHLALKYYSKVPESVRDKVTPAHKHKAKQLYVRSRRLVKKPQFLRPKPGKAVEVQFKAEDTLLVMGKPWDYPTFMETIRKQKLATGFKLVQVVYDLIPVFQPQLHGEPLIKQYTQHMFEVASLSDGLLAISKSTKNDMLKFCKRLNIPAPPIEVIRLGDDFTKVDPKKPSNKAIVKEQFILCVGTIEIRKNHKMLYLVYKLAAERGIKLPDLVIVGSVGWYTHDVIYEFTHDPELKDRVHILHQVSDSELSWLYHNCILTVYPSIYEGWGLPIAESLLYGKVCIPSNASSMTEMAGDLLEYHSPFDAEALLDLLQKYLNKQNRSKKEAAIKAEYKPTLWSQTYEQATKFTEKTVN